MSGPKNEKVLEAVLDGGESVDVAPPCRFRSDIPVTLIPELTCGSDRMTSRAAWVIRPGETRPDESDKAYSRLIKACVAGRHTSPIEKGLMTVYVEAPLSAWVQWTRHRFMGSGDLEDFGFSVSSGRYRVLDGTFYVPPPERPCFEPPGFKPMRPCLVSAKQYLADKDPVWPYAHADDDGYSMAQRQHRLSDLETLVERELKDACEFSYRKFTRMVDAGVGREVARLALGPAAYFSGYVEAKPATWLHFFSLRTNDPRNRTATHPQWEIEQVSRQCEAFFAAQWPITYAAFNESGRSL